MLGRNDAERGLQAGAVMEGRSFLLLCNLALDTYGADAQIDQCIEECAELTVELQHRKRGRPDHAAEEIADVMICAHQMRLLVGPEDVDAEMRRKLARLEQRMG